MQVVYSKDNCPGCDRLLSEYASNGWLEGQEFIVKKLGKDISVDEFLNKFPGVRSVPYVITEQAIKKALGISPQGLILTAPS